MHNLSLQTHVATMFVTQTQFEQPVPAGIAAPGNRFWRAVGLTLQTPWYLCVYRTSNQARPKTCLVSWESDLRDLVASHEALNVIAVARLDDAAPNSALWSMRWIKSIWLATRDEREEVGSLVFQFDDDAALKDDMLRSRPHRPDRVQIFRCAEAGI